MKYLLIERLFQTDFTEYVNTSNAQIIINISNSTLFEQLRR